MEATGESIRDKGQLENLLEGIVDVKVTTAGVNHSGNIISTHNN